MHPLPIAWHKPSGTSPETAAIDLATALADVRKPVYITDIQGKTVIFQDGETRRGGPLSPYPGEAPLLAFSPPLPPEDLGSPDFKARHQLRYAYVSGGMAHGIASIALTRAAADGGMMGFFGSAGLAFDDLKNALFMLKTALGEHPYGLNLVYTGNDELEWAVVDLYLKHGVRRLCAAGYLKLTLPLLWFRIKGLRQEPNGGITGPHQLIAKTSRLEIARQFLSPAPEKMVKLLLDQRRITPEEARLALMVPVAEDLTAEADSGGHTDNRAALCLLPAMLDLRDEIAGKYHYATRPCIGLGGGIGTPPAVCAAFAMGADYVLAGSVHQACRESGTSDVVRDMLAEASQTDVAMAPSANLFERGVKVQVLKRGTLFPQRAAKLYDLYKTHDSLESIPASEKVDIETAIFQTTLENQWNATRQFFETYDPDQIELAEKDPKRKMALVFRSYLGLSAKWAISGDLSRKKDFQIWCGPSMGAFNEWTRGSFLAEPANRDFQTVAMNLLFGACVETRRHWLASFGYGLSSHIGRYKPLNLSLIRTILNNKE